MQGLLTRHQIAHWYTRTSSFCNIGKVRVGPTGEASSQTLMPFGLTTVQNLLFPFFSMPSAFIITKRRPIRYSLSDNFCLFCLYYVAVSRSAVIFSINFVVEHHQLAIMCQTYLCVYSDSLNEC